VTGLLGPNGAGKTTLIRCIVGVQIVESGSVSVLGEEAGSPPLRRRVGYVTQAPSVYADLTVLSEDPLTTPEPRLSELKVKMTVVGGRVTFPAKD